MVRFWVAGWVTTVFLLSASHIEAGDNRFPVLTGPYFGQQVPGLQAQPFAPGLISLEGRYEFALSFSPGGDELLFTQQVPEKLVSVFHSRVEEGVWTEPVSVQLSGGARREEMEAFFAPDGKLIFFAPYDEGMDVRIWALEVGPEGWRNPRELASPVADDPAFYPTMSNRGTLYYTNLAARRIYRAEIEGLSVTSVEDAGLEFGGHAFIARDESFVLLDARDHDSLGGSDIYVAFRSPAGGWERPLHLGGDSAPLPERAFFEALPHALGLAQPHIDLGCQHGEIDGLGEIVIGSLPQTLDHIVLIGESRKKNKWHVGKFRMFVANDLENVESAHRRHCNIAYHHVRA